MKTFYRATMLGLLMVVLTAFTSVAVMAQGDDDQDKKTELYTCFVENYDKYTIPQQEKALTCAKEFIAKFPGDTQIVDYFKGQIPDIEKWIDTEKKRIAVKVQAEADKKARAARIKRFNDSYKAAVANTTESTWREVFAATEAIINNDKDIALDAKILLANSGTIYLAAAKTPIDTFNNKIIENAESVIEDINSGKKSERYGVFDSELKTKENTLAKMYEVIGYIKFERQGKQEDGMVQYYKVLQHKKDPSIYKRIGAWYSNKAAKLGQTRLALDQKDEANLPQIKEYLEMERGYIARAIDSYARAYNLAPAADKKALYDRLKELFNFRYTQPREAPMKTDISINSYIASVNTKEMPNPATEVMPIKLEEPKPVEVDKPVDAKSEMKDGETKPSETKPAVKKDAKISTKNGTTRSRTVSKSKSDN